MRRGFSVVVFLLAASAFAAGFDVYGTRVIGWDATTRTFVVERREGFVCEGCSCGTTQRTFHLVAAGAKSSTRAIVEHDDCEAEYSVFKPDAGALPAKALTLWDPMRPIVERALASGVEGDFGSFVAEEGLLVRVLVEGPPPPKKPAGEFGFDAEFDFDAINPETRVSGVTVQNDRRKGVRTIVLERTDATHTRIATVRWKPECAEAACTEVRVRWANDGSAVAITAGPAVASFNHQPGAEPKMPAARVFVIDVRTGVVTTDAR